MSDNCNLKLFWRKNLISVEELHIDNPTFLRHRKASCSFHDDSIPVIEMVIEKKYQNIYFETLDLITSCIKDHIWPAWLQDEWKSWNISP